MLLQMKVKRPLEKGVHGLSLMWSVHAMAAGVLIESGVGTEMSGGISFFIFRSSEKSAQCDIVRGLFVINPLSYALIESL